MKPKLNEWHCEATETLFHQWTVEAATRKEAEELAGNGCPDDCCNGEFGDITIRTTEELEAISNAPAKELTPTLAELVLKFLDTLPPTNLTSERENRRALKDAALKEVA